MSGDRSCDAPSLPPRSATRRGLRRIMGLAVFFILKETFSRPVLDLADLASGFGDDFAEFFRQGFYLSLRNVWRARNTCSIAAWWVPFLF